MKRLLGIRKKVKETPPPPPQISDCITNVDQRADETEKKVYKLQADFKKISEQLKSAKSGPAKKALQQKALHILQHLKAYESQADGLRQQSFNMDQATNSVQTAQETHIILKTMKAGITKMKKDYAKIDVDEIQDLQEEMADILVASDDVQEALGRSYNMPDVDEDELQAEFDALGDEIALDESSSYVDDVGGAGAPQAPTSRGTDSPRVKTVEGIVVDEFGLPILPEPGTSDLQKVRKD